MGRVEVRIRGIFSFEEGTCWSFDKTFQGHLAIDQCSDNFSRSRRTLLENADVSGEDVRTNHGVSLNLEGEKTRRTGQIERRGRNLQKALLRDTGFRDHRKSCGDRTRDGDSLQGGGGQNSASFAFAPRQCPLSLKRLQVPLSRKRAGKTEVRLNLANGGGHPLKPSKLFDEPQNIFLLWR